MFGRLILPQLHLIVNQTICLNKFQLFSCPIKGVNCCLVACNGLYENHSTFWIWIKSHNFSSCSCVTAEGTPFLRDCCAFCWLCALFSGLWLSCVFLATMLMGFSKSVKLPSLFMQDGMTIRADGS